VGFLEKPEPGYSARFRKLVPGGIPKRLQSHGGDNLLKKGDQGFPAPKSLLRTSINFQQPLNPGHGYLLVQWVRLNILV
jgi:hypothetical protein